MTDQNLILEALSAMENRLDRIEAQRREDNERIEKRLEAIEPRFESMNTQSSSLRQDVAWIKGRLESEQEERTNRLSIFAITTAVAAMIIVLIGVFI